MATEGAKAFYLRRPSIGKGFRFSEEEGGGAGELVDRSEGPDRIMLSNSPLVHKLKIQAGVGTHVSLLGCRRCETDQVLLEGRTNADGIFEFVVAGCAARGCRALPRYRP